MSSKRAFVGSGSTGAKRSRKALSLAVKIDIINRLDRGERLKSVCTALHLASSTVHTIYKQKDRVLKMADTCFGGVKLHRVTKSRTSLMGKLENLLAHWIESHNQQNVPLSFSIIQEQALALFEDLKKEAEDKGTATEKDMEFKASHGWFERFKNRVNLHNMRLADDKTEFDSARTFPQELQRIVEDGGYLPKQIFNIDETGLYWKRLPSLSFIAKEESESPGFKVSKERMTILLGGNLEGDCKLKPLLVYYTENPKALKGLNKASLPVIWRFNKKASLHKELFADYISGYLSPFLASYFAKNKVDNKALLVMDNAPYHQINVEDYADNIRVVYIPAPVTSIIQPLEQGVMASFRANYLLNVIRNLVSASDGDNKPTIKMLWKDYNIKSAIENIAASWSRITPSNMNGIWKNLLPKLVYNFQGFAVEIKTLHYKIVKLCDEAGFNEVDVSDVQQLLEAHNEELTREELIQMEAEKSQEGDDSDDDDNDDEEVEVPMKTLDVKTLTEFFTTLEKAMQIIEDNDPNLERSSACRRKLNEDVQCYRQLYETKRKSSVVQSNILTLYQLQKSYQSQLSSSAINGSGILMEVDEKDGFLYSQISDEALGDAEDEDLKLSHQELVALAAASNHSQTLPPHTSLFGTTDTAS